MLRLFIVISMIIIAGAGGFGQSINTGLNENTISQALGINHNPTDIPHIILDVPGEDTPLGRTLAQYRLFEEYGTNLTRVSPLFTNGSPVIHHTILGKDVTFVFADWVVQKLQGIDVLSYLNPGMGKELWDMAELDKLDSSLEKGVINAVEHIWDRLDPKAIETQMIGILSEQLDMDVTQVEKDLEKIVQLDGGYNVTTREFMNVPSFNKADFVPDTVVVAALPDGIFAATTVGTIGSKRVVIYSPLAWKEDTILEDNMIMQHEFIHADSQLQNIPLIFYADVELYAELGALMMDRDPFELYFHGYLAPVRRMVRALFGFDTQAAASQLFEFNTVGVLTINEEKYNAFYEKIQTISAEIKRFVREKLYPTFYAQPLFWTSFAIRLCEAYAPFDMMMSLAYEPTILGGAEDTAMWLAQHESQIRDMATDALKKAGEKKKNPEELDSDLEGFSSCPLNAVPMPASTMKLWANPDFRAWFNTLEAMTDDN